jgi:hypothetical protein
MAKQLEEALKRPAGSVPPPPAPTPARPPQDEDLMDEDELLEPPVPPVHGPVASSQGIYANEPEEEEPVDEPEPSRPKAEPARPAPAPPASPAAPQAAEPPAPPKPAQRTPDPFSVEEIEAEFARLLGRPLDTGKKD